MKLQPAEAYAMAKKFAADCKGDLSEIVGTVLMAQGGESDFDFIAKQYDDLPLSEAKLYSTSDFATYLSKLNDVEKIKSGIQMIFDFKKKIPAAYTNFTDPIIKQALEIISNAKGGNIAEFIQKKLN